MFKKLITYRGICFSDLTIYSCNWAILLVELYIYTFLPTISFYRNKFIPFLSFTFDLNKELNEVEPSVCTRGWWIVFYLVAPMEVSTSGDVDLKVVVWFFMKSCAELKPDFVFHIFWLFLFYAFFFIQFLCKTI